MTNRLYVGVLVMVKRVGLTQQNHIEKFVGWYASENEARGDMVARVCAKHPDGQMDPAFSVDDITEIARPGFAA